MHGWDGVWCDMHGNAVCSFPAFFVAGVQAKDIQEVLLVGGMTRMPKVISGCDVVLGRAGIKWSSAGAWRGTEGSLVVAACTGALRAAQERKWWRR
jgi:hypothetical protein